MTDERRVAVVTGGNRGLGFGVSRELAKQGYRVLLCARDKAKGEAAKQEIGADNIEVMELDVANEASIRSFGNQLREKVERVDVLVNNAGVLRSDEREGSVLTAERESVQEVLATNLLGAMQVAQEVVPLMLKGRSGRIVNVSSGLGQLDEMGTGTVSYRLSKVALNAVTRMLAAETRDEGVLVNSVCPGWVKTDMGGPNAHRTLEEGISGIVWAATLPDDGPTGGFFRDGKAIPW